MRRNASKALVIAAAGAAIIALAATPLHAFTGNLVRCTPSLGTGVVVTLKKGLTCTESLNKIQVKATVKTGNAIDGCVANAAAPWDAWAAGKVASKISAANAALINRADVMIKASTYGSCNFGGSPDSYGASGAGKLTFYDAVGNKVKGGKGSFFASVAGDLATQSALARGLMTKGFGAGGLIQVQIAIDIGAPENGLVVACNAGAICPPDPFGNNAKCTGLGTPTACCTGSKEGTCVAPITQLVLATNANSNLSIDLPDNDNCTGPSEPIFCCTGAGTGTC
jgi:hypothetical protein